MIDKSGSSSFITTRPVAILMIFLAAAVFGFLSLGRLPVTLMPELTYPTVTVRTEYPGAAPEEVENDISRPIEEQLGVVAGLKQISSISRAGVSDVVLEFSWDTEMSEATQAALEKLDMVFLPDEANRPLILHYDPSLDPVMELSLSGEGRRFEGEPGMRRLRRLAELRLKKDLEPVKGVAAVRVRGGLEEEIHVRLEEEALRRSGISIQAVINRLAQENINVAGGTLKEGRTEYLVRTLNEFENLDQIADTIVTRSDDRNIRIRDLGTVEMAHREREIVTRTDGRDSVQIEIYKEGDANIVGLAHRIKSMLGELKLDDPDDDGEDGEAAVSAGNRGGGGDDARGTGVIQRIYEDEGAILAVVADRSLFIESSIDDVRNTAVIGGLLAVLVLYLFLRNALSTAIVAVSIPISLVITFAPLHLLDVSMNIMSLGGLALGIGMLVDSSIVVLESIYRCREEGDESSAATIRGTKEVRAAVVASTMTSIAVFLPMVFVEGIAGQAFGDLGLAVVVSLLASAAVALLFIPMLTNRAGMGLTVVFLVGATLALGKFGTPQIQQGVAALVGVLFVAGLLYILVVGILGKLGLDTFSRKAMGLWRWHSWHYFRSQTGRPLAFFRALRRRPQSTLWRLGWMAMLPLMLVVAVAGFVVSYLYLVLRFVLGSVLEWGIGKPVVLGFLGAASMVVRWFAPLVGWVFRIVAWIPSKLTGALLGAVSNIYPRIIRSALAHPLVIVLIIAGCFWVTWDVTRGLDSELLPEVHQGEFTVEVSLPVGTPLEENESVLEPVEQAILAERENIRSMVLTLGYDSTNSQRSDEGEHTARFKILLEGDGNTAELEYAVIDRLRQKFDSIPDLEARVIRPVLFSSKTPIEVEIQGDELGQLKRTADEATALLAALPELADVETTLRSGAPEVQIVYDRDRLTRYGLNIRQVAELVRDKVKGNEATRFNLKDRRIPILVRLSMDDRETVEDIRGIIINPGGERPIRLAAVADVSLGEGPSEVRRVDGRRVALIRANMADASLSTASWKIRDTLERRIEWPAQMSFFISGQNEEWENSRASLWIALSLSVFLVYVIMAAQFESLIHPLVIMLTIPLAFFGTVLTLKAMGLSLSIVVFLGMIMLAGIVVNNAIVMVDYINTLRQRGMPRDEAVVTAGAVRLRPILMTTATTVLGLTPMAVGLGDGAEIRTPMAIAVISGLISSTALTLLVIPTIYVLADRMKNRLLGIKEPASSPSRESGVAGAPAFPATGPDAVTS